MGAVEGWDASRYDARFGYVSAGGAGLLDLLAPRPGERVLDLGCGTGELLALLASRDVVVSGIDADPAMVAAARARLPGVRIECADGHRFEVEEPFDAVLSNAALHWMTRPDEVLACVRAALRPGGRFVAEMGGHCNVGTVLSALGAALDELGLPLPDPIWYFPSVSEHASRLETAGFEVARIEHFARPTPLVDCPGGLVDWLDMFAPGLLASVPPELLEAVLARTAQLAAPALLRDGTWVLDYWRLRFVALVPAAGSLKDG